MNRRETAESSSQAGTRAIDGKQNEVDEANKHKAMSYVRMKQVDKMILAGVKKMLSRPRR